jgi:hypothetical protein
MKAISLRKRMNDLRTKPLPKKPEEIKVDNAAKQEWNQTVNAALVEGIPEEDILKIKQEKISDKTLQSIILILRKMVKLVM